MRILAIETSCDETAIAIVDFSGPVKRPAIRILSNLVSSQAKLHAKFGGVVPNLAKREHQKNLVPIFVAALKEAKLFKKDKNYKSALNNYQHILEREPELLDNFEKNIIPLAPPKIDVIAVTYGPGLAPALWVGVNFARAIACIWNKPIIPINHMEGHLYSAIIAKSLANKFKLRTIRFPALALLVSGGHTELVLMLGFGKYKIIGETLDDAAGEAFDKVARILGLGYPGGPEIAKEAKKQNHFGFKEKFVLPRPMLNSKDYNFSFSGLKTSVLYLMRDISKKYDLKSIRPAVAMEFQEAVAEVLVKKTLRAAKNYKAKTILLGGGVAANILLRDKLSSTVKKELTKVNFFTSPFNLTGDNALMIALAARFYGNKKAWSKIHADANLRLS